MRTNKFFILAFLGVVSGSLLIMAAGLFGGNEKNFVATFAGGLVCYFFAFSNCYFLLESSRIPAKK